MKEPTTYLRCVFVVVSCWLFHSVRSVDASILDVQPLSDPDHPFHELVGLKTTEEDSSSEKESSYPSSLNRVSIPHEGNDARPDVALSPGSVVGSPPGYELLQVMRYLPSSDMSVAIDDLIRDSTDTATTSTSTRSPSSSRSRSSPSPPTPPPTSSRSPDTIDRSRGAVSIRVSENEVEDELESRALTVVNEPLLQCFDDLQTLLLGPPSSKLGLPTTCDQEGDEEECRSAYTRLLADMPAFDGVSEETSEGAREHPPPLADTLYEVKKRVGRGSYGEIWKVCGVV